MFQGKTATEYRADAEKLKAEIAQIEKQKVDRQLKRAKKSLLIEDREDKLLEIQISSFDNKVAVALAQLEGEKILLQTAKSKTRYLQAKHQLQERSWATDLMIGEVELSASQAKLNELRNVAQTLSYPGVKGNSARTFGGGTND